MAYTQYIEQIIMFICNVVFDLVYHNKTSKYIIINGAHAHKCYVQNSRYYSVQIPLTSPREVETILEETPHCIQGESLEHGVYLT